jgi:hypothetical protein
VACEWEFFALTHNVPELWQAQAPTPEPKEMRRWKDAHDSAPESVEQGHPADAHKDARR